MPEAYTLVPPIFHTAPDYDYTLGDEVGDVASMAGLPPDPEQQIILDDTFAVRDDKSAARDVGVCAPRQNLKTGSLKQMTLGWLYVLELPLVTWTAHKFDTSQEAFRDMKELIQSTPDLDREVMKITEAKGDEGIELTGGRRLKFKARTIGGSRGVTGNRIVLDEAMYLVGAHLAALAPTLRAVPDPQLVYAGSAGFADSHVWRTLRDRGRAGGDPYLSWSEWASDAEPGGCAIPECSHLVGTRGCALDDEDRLRRSNSALGRRITLDSLKADRLSMPAENYAVETLGWWEDPAEGNAPFSIPKWATLADWAGAYLDLTDLRVAIDMPPERQSVSITVCGRRPDGVPQIEVMRIDSGTEWVIPWLAGLRKRRQVREFVVDGASAAMSFVEGMKLAGLNVTVTNAREMAAACGALHDAVNELAVHHVPHEALERAITGARKRALSGAWVLDRKNATVDISPLVAAVLAHWAVTRSRRQMTDEELLNSVH